jgi:hypothetical protein
MSAALLAALVLAAAPPLVTPGAFSVELTRPRDDGPALLRHLEWASLVEPELSPQRLQRRVSAAFGPELWSESGLARWGVAKDRPMRFHDRGGAQVRVAELVLADPKAAVTQLVALGPRLLGARARADLVVAGDTPANMVGAYVAGDRLWLALGDTFAPPPIPPAGRAPRALPAKGDAVADWLVALTRERPLADARAPKELGTPSMLGAANGAGGVERVTGGARFEGAWVEARGEARVVPGVEVALGEVVRGKATSVRLLEVAEPTFRGAAALSRSGVRAVAERVGIDAPSAAALAVVTGNVELVVTQEGAILVALELTKAPPAAALDKLRRAVTGRWRGAELALVEVERRPPLVLASLGPRDGLPKSLASLRAPEGAKDAAPLIATLAPRRVLRALEGRAGSPDGLSLEGMELMAFRMLAQGFLDATERVELTLSPAGRRVGFVARVVRAEGR